MTTYYTTYLLSHDQFESLFTNNSILNNYFLASEIGESLLRGINQHQFLRGRWAVKCGLIQLLYSLSIRCNPLDIEIKSKKHGVSVSIKQRSQMVDKPSICIETSISHESNYSIALIVLELV